MDTDSMVGQTQCETQWDPSPLTGGEVASNRLYSLPPTDTPSIASVEDSFYLRCQPNMHVYGCKHEPLCACGLTGRLNVEPGL